MSDPRTDEELLAAVDGEPEAFGVFYGRHVRPLLGYFVRRTGGAELAADMCAETFAAALDGLGRFDRGRGPAVAWLYGIARRLLANAASRGVVEDRARRRLGMAPLDLTDAAIERIESEAGEVATAALEALPPDQREAVRARILDERDYADIARTTQTSEAVVRKRVSRGLAGLLARVKAVAHCDGVVRACVVGVHARKRMEGPCATADEIRAHGAISGMLPAGDGLAVMGLAPPRMRSAQAVRGDRVLDLAFAGGISVASCQRRSRRAAPRRPACRCRTSCSR